MQEETPEPKLTPEQIAEFVEFKRQRQEHFEKEIPNLKVQRDYEQLLTEIDELYLRRLIVQVKVGQLQTPPSPEDQKQIEEPKEFKERKLKTT